MYLFWYVSSLFSFPFLYNFKLRVTYILMVCVEIFFEK